MARIKIACVQMTSVLEPAVNLGKLEDFLGQAREQKCQAVFLPEVYLSKGDGAHQTPYQVSFNNQLFRSIQDLVRRHQLAVLGGSVIFNDGEVVCNRVINFDGDGNVINYYDKMHMFSCRLTDRSPPLVIDEEQLCVPGKTPMTTCLGPFKIGMSVCFDLRYPPLYQNYRKAGAHVLSISSAFTVPTGKAHWHTLVRARAIETQCYVVASCQWGQHNQQSTSYGHSLIVDPWGEVIADGGEGEKMLTATLDMARVQEVRGQINIERYL